MSPAYFVLALFCIFGVATAQYNPTAKLYDALNCGGAFVKIPQNNYVPDLSQIAFDNKAQSVFLRGPWMFYDLQNYNYAQDALMEYIFESSERCVNFIDIGGYSSSVKYAGHSGDYRVDTITFYEYTYFQAAEELVQYDMPNLALHGRIASLIVTGTSAWTIYDMPSYGGNAICLEIEPSPNYEPAFVPNTALLDPTVPRGAIASVQKGCHTKNILKVKRSKTSVHNKSVDLKISF